MIDWDGVDFSAGKEAPSDPVVCRQELQWHISAQIGISRHERREPGADTAPQRQVRCAEDEGNMVPRVKSGGVWQESNWRALQSIHSDI